MFVFPEVFPTILLCPRQVSFFPFFKPSAAAAAAAAEEERCRNRGGKPRKKSDETLMKTNKLHRHVQEKEQCVPFLIKYALRYISGPYKTSSIFNVRTLPRPLFADTGCRHSAKKRLPRSAQEGGQGLFSQTVSSVFPCMSHLGNNSNQNTVGGTLLVKKLPGLSHRDLRSGLMVCFFF